MLDSAAQELIDVLTAQDDDRPRSQQTVVGPSQVGGCAAQLWFHMHGGQKINKTERLAAMLGTAIHKAVEDAFIAHGPDTYMYELEVPGIDGLVGPGHIDRYDTSEYVITDYKTTTLKALRYFPKGGQKIQVHIYGYLASKAGYRVDTVELIAIPRDGHEKHVKVWREAYDEQIAVEALERLANIRDMAEVPDPEMGGAFCQGWCPFYGANLDNGEVQCLGKG